MAFLESTKFSGQGYSSVYMYEDERVSISIPQEKNGYSRPTSLGVVRNMRVGVWLVGMVSMDLV